MNEPFKVSAQNIQVVIGMLLPYTYSQEYLYSIGWDRESCDNGFMFDCSIAVNLLGGHLLNKKDFEDIN